MFLVNLTLINKYLGNKARAINIINQILKDNIVNKGYIRYNKLSQYLDNFN